LSESNAALPQPKRGHPPGLYVLFFAEMWERFCYYGMRTLLIFYLTQDLLFADKPAYGIYGAYTALVYAAPVLGGKLADELLGYRRAVVMGGILMAIGEFMLVGNDSFSGNALLYLGMGTIIVGNGYFKANISSIVGKLYGEGDPRRDSGFTIFYMGINIGAWLATAVCGYVGATYGYKWGFALAGIGMIIGILVFLAGRGKLEDLGHPPDVERLHERVFGPLSRWHVTVLASLGIIPVLYFLITSEGAVAAASDGASGWVAGVAWVQQTILFGMSFVDVLLGGTMLIVVANLLRGAIEAGKVAPPEKRTVQRDRMVVLFILMAFNIMFWALFEQAGTSLSLFAERAVDRNIELIGWEMPAAMTQNFNPSFIIIFGSLFSWLWVQLDKRGLNPSIPLKFAFALIQLGAGYLLLVAGASVAGADFKVPLAFLFFMYLLHTTGELCISPIGLSMVTKLAPAKLTGTVMGAWFLSFAIANKVAAGLAKLTGAEEGAGENVEMAAEEVLNTYVGTYQNFGLVIIGFGVLLILLARWLNKMMHGVK
jgi:POT family proton-dependent oligopeptide transporter